MKPLERIHLDPLGGIAGDMFVAALADAFPELVPAMMQELARLGGRGRIRLEARRFVVECETDGHHHVPHRAVRAQLQAAGLAPDVLAHALAMFALLAEAEGRVHGVAPDAVEFHEVGAWDSIVDFVAAAFLIARLAPARWTWSPLPLGGGRVRTAHGILPVPAPATALLLAGFEVVDDGIGGERVTPTGAAILRHLAKTGDRPRLSHTKTGVRHRLSNSDNRGLSPVLVASGCGYGSRELPGMPNVLRVLAFEAAAGGAGDEDIATLTFEVDDQTAEDLAVAIDRLRAAAGVLEVYQAAVHGKKGRLATQVQVLARVEAVDAVAEECLAQTTTLGLRIARVQRRTLARAAVEPAAPLGVRAKVATRPSGEATAKAEMDDLARIPGARREREAARAAAEARALETVKAHGPRSRKRD